MDLCRIHRDITRVWSNSCANRVWVPLRTRASSRAISGQRMSQSKCSSRRSTSGEGATETTARHEAVRSRHGRRFVHFQKRYPGSVLSSLSSRPVCLNLIHDRSRTGAMGDPGLMERTANAALPRVSRAVHYRSLLRSAWQEVGCCHGAGSIRRTTNRNRGRLDCGDGAALQCKIAYEQPDGLRRNPRIRGDHAIVTVSIRFNCPHAAEDIQPARLADETWQRPSHDCLKRCDAIR